MDETSSSSSSTGQESPTRNQSRTRRMLIVAIPSGRHRTQSGSSRSGISIPSGAAARSTRSGMLLAIRLIELAQYGTCWRHRPHLQRNRRSARVTDLKKSRILRQRLRAFVLGCEPVKRRKGLIELEEAAFGVGNRDRVRRALQG